MPSCWWTTSGQTPDGRSTVSSFRSRVVIASAKETGVTIEICTTGNSDNAGNIEFMGLQKSCLVGKCATRPAKGDTHVAC